MVRRHANRYACSCKDVLAITDLDFFSLLAMVNKVSVATPPVEEACSFTSIAVGLFIY